MAAKGRRQKEIICQFVEQEEAADWRCRGGEEGMGLIVARGMLYVLLRTAKGNQ